MFVKERGSQLVLQQVQLPLALHSAMLILKYPLKIVSIKTTSTPFKADGGLDALVACSRCVGVSRER